MDTNKAVTALSALAQETRLTVFRLLVEAGPRGVSAGDIASRLNCAPATLSFHLKELHRAELVHDLFQCKLAMFVDVTGRDYDLGFQFAESPAVTVTDTVHVGGRDLRQFTDK